MKTRKMTAAMLAAIFAAGTLMTGCGSSSASDSTQEAQTASASAATKAGEASTQAATVSADNGITDAEPEEEKSYTYLLSMGSECKGYDEYEDNPCVKYWLGHTWNVDGTPTKVSIDFSVLPDGSQSDNMNTLLATGDYSDIMSMDYASQTALQLYDEGIALDLTDYVEKYMPNYVAWASAHPEYQLTNDIDGEQRYIQLYNVADAPEAAWGGFMYRRDWLVKYGTNPETGEAFTGGWNDDKTEWTDDVVFPSGGTDPVYISDWEWMLDIFNTALQQEGVTDGYAFQLYYTGSLSSGDLNSGFGGCMGTYMDADGTAVDGMPTDSSRAYIECMAKWYANGWTDPSFEERSSDTFFMEDLPSIYAGKVGLWYGYSSELGNALQGDDALLDGICVYGAAQPVNDVYGSDAQKNNEPTCFYQQQLVTGSVIITDHVDEDDLPALLTALDYNYSREGSLLHSWGLSDTQMAETNDSVYAEYGLTDGIYSLVDEDGTETVKVDRSYESNPDAGGLVGLNMVRVVGEAANANVDMGNPAVIQHGIDEWEKYTATGQVPTTLSSQLTSDQSEELSTIQASIDPYVAQEVPSFITGREDISDDSAWEAFCDQLNDYGSGKRAEYLNEINAQ